MFKLEEIISKDFILTGSGRYLKTLEHDSLVIDTEKNIFFWNSREIFGGPFDYLTKVKGVSYQEAKNILGTFTPEIYIIHDDERRDVVVNDELVHLFFDLGKYHRDYWRQERGYHDTTIDLFRLGYSGEWYTIPIFVEGKLRNFQCRKPKDEQGNKAMRSWYRYQGSLPFNLDYVKEADFGVLTEGPVDAIMCMQNGIPAMSHNAGASNFNPLWAGQLRNVKDIFIVYDNDDAGRKGAKYVASFFGNKARVFNFDGFPERFDVTDYFKAGGNKDEFLDLITNESKLKEEV